MSGKEGKKRYALVLSFLICLFLAFLTYLFNIQIIDTKQKSNTIVSSVEVSVDAIRGDILDRNGYPLVTNHQVNKIIFNFLGFPTDYTERNVIILELIKIFDKNKVEWNDKLPIKIKKGVMKFDKEKENEIAYLKSEAFLDLNYYADVEDCFNALVERYKLEGYTLSQQRDIASVYYSMVKNGFNAGRNYEFATDVSSALVSVIKQRSKEFPGVDVQIASERHYTDGKLAPHILGVVGPITNEEYEARKEEGYTLNDVIGKSGVESTMESYLKGKKGIKAINTDAAGNKSEEYILMPETGNTVILTIDHNIQKIAQDALAEAVKRLQTKYERIYPMSGAVVVMNAKNNEVLAMASYPTYDNSKYHKNSDKLNRNETKPLWNRALRSTYTPGSTIKPAVAMAGLQEKVIKGSTFIQCLGRYTYYEDYQPGCRGEVHGNQDVVHAIYNSCNVFFYETSRLLGIDRLNSYFAMFGLGEKTGIELNESAGSVDSVALRKSLGEIWTPGLTIQAGIGHGNNQFTPIQLCAYVSTIANKGTRYKASIIKSVKSADLSETIMENSVQVLSQANFSEKNWKYVHKGMLLVGTESYVDFSELPVKVAAKTGTTTIEKTVKGRKIETWNGLIITFAPYNDPEIAIAVVVEGAGSGGSTSSVATAVMDYYFADNKTEENHQNENTLLN